jgi:hypothetical protein
MYDLAPLPFPHPLSSQQVVSLSQFFCVLPVEQVMGGGGEPNYTKRRKGIRYCTTQFCSVLSKTIYTRIKKVNIFNFLNVNK